MDILKKTLSFLDSCVARVTKFGVILCLVVLFALLLARVIARTVEIPFAAYDEIVELATVWLIILGAVALWREGALYRVDVVTAALTKLGRPAEVAIQVIMLAFAVMLVWVGGSFTVMNREVTAFMQIDKIYYYGAIPAAGAVMALYSAAALLEAVCVLFRGKPPHKHQSDRPISKAAVEHL